MKRQGKVIPGASSESQTGVLRHRIADAGIRHGDTARIRIDNVASRRVQGVGRQVYFCHSSVTILKLIEQGDGGDIPQEMVEVSRLGRVPDGVFSLEATIRSNGRLTLDDSRVVKQTSRQEMLAGV